jgi:hypothetical protein
VLERENNNKNTQKNKGLKQCVKIKEKGQAHLFYSISIQLPHFLYDSIEPSFDINHLIVFATIRLKRMFIIKE